MPMETVFDHLLRTIAEAFSKPGGENTPIKNVVEKLDPQILKEAEPVTGGSDFIGSGYQESGTQLRSPYEYKRPQTPPSLIEEMGNQYAPSNPYGATPPNQQEDIRNTFEQKSYGLDGLRESFMNEGMAPSIDVGLPSYQGTSINALNMRLLQEEMRKNSRPPGNMGWR